MPDVNQGREHDGLRSEAPGGEPCVPSPEGRSEEGAREQGGRSREEGGREEGAGRHKMMEGKS